MGTFVGRQRELREVQDALAEFGLVTLFGLPGAGKTAIGLEVMRLMGATAIVRCRTDLTAADLDRYRGEPMVLLDDADRLQLDVQQRLEELVATNDTRWLATARRRLGLAGEATRHIGPFDHQDGESEAVQLLELLLRQRNVQYEPHELARVARRVEGHAHGLCLAAKDVELIGTHDLLERDDFTALERVFDAELDVLGENEMAALAAAAAFAASFSATAFERVAAAPLSVLQSLVDHAFAERPSDTRKFRVSRVLAKVARKRASAAAALVRHAHWALETGDRAELRLVAERGIHGEVPPEVAIEAVVALTRGPQPPVHLVDWALGLSRHFDLICARAHIALHESDLAGATELIGEASARATTPVELSSLHQLRAALARITATPDDALREYAKALELPPTDAQPSLLLNHAAALWETGEHEAALDATRIALERARSAGDARREGVVTSNLGVMAHNAGEYDEARELHERALDLHRACGNRRFEGIATFDLGTLDHELGHCMRALDGYRHAIPILDEARDHRVSALARAAAACAAAQLGWGSAWDITTIREAFEQIGDATVAEAVALYEKLREHCQSVSMAHDFEGPPFDASPYARRSDEVQIPARALARLTAALVSHEALIVAADRSGFRIAGQHVDLRTREANRNIFSLLVDRYLKGEPTVDVPTLIECGWPGEVVEPEAAKNRTHVALSELRRVGLRPFLRTVEGGYALADVTVVVTR